MSEQYIHNKGPTPEDFVRFVPYVCTQMQAPFYIEIQTFTIEEPVNKDAKGRTKSKRAIDIGADASTIGPAERQAESSSSPFAGVSRGACVPLTVALDSAGRLLELRFTRCADIPALLLRVVALCLPYQPALARVTVRWGPPYIGFALELAAMLPNSNITELCFDDSPLHARACDALLATRAQLRSLSLARCDLNDEACVLLAEHLRHGMPAASTLVVLSLASNAITDLGAAALGNALRTNRALRHLNLAGNMLTDEGAGAIFLSLAPFRLTPEEVADKRKRLLDHLQRKEAIYAKCLNELALATGEREKQAPNAKKKPPTARARQSSFTPTMSSLALRAEAMTGELLGLMQEPFGAEQTVRREDGLYCYGNLTLVHLNLAYNNLQLPGVALLLRVLQAQARAGSGLLRVLLDGNPLPTACVELELASELLASALGAADNKQTNKKPERVKKK